MSRLKAAVLSVLIMAGLAVPLGCLALAVALAMFFEQGGGLGGFGGAPSDAFQPRTWPTVISYVAVAVAILLDLGAGLLSYHLMRRRRAD